MAEITFSLVDNQYVSYRDGVPFGKPMQEVAIALDTDNGARMKVGDPADVNAWCDAHRQAFARNGYPAIADDLVVMQGRFLIGDLDCLMAVSGHAMLLYRQLQDGSIRYLDAQGQEIDAALAA